jgi:hypothetical protein
VHTHGAAGSRDYLLVLAARAADGDTLQVSRSEIGVPPLRPYPEVRNDVLRQGGSALFDEMTTAVQRVYHDDLSLDRYDEIWEAASRTRYNETWEDLQDGD